MPLVALEYVRCDPASGKQRCGPPYLDRASFSAREAPAVRVGVRVLDQDSTPFDWATNEELERRVAEGLGASADNTRHWEAIAEWFFAHHREFEGYARKRIEDPQDREDYFQWFMSKKFRSVWTAFANHPRKEDGGARTADGFKPYFATAFGRDIQDWLAPLITKKKRLPEVPLADHELTVQIIPTTNTDQFEAAWLKQRAFLCELTHELQEAEREVLILMLDKGLPPDEVARRTGKKIGTVRTYKSRGIQNLQLLLYPRWFHVKLDNIADGRALAVALRGAREGLLSNVRHALTDRGFAAVSVLADGLYSDESAALIVDELNHNVIDVETSFSKSEIASVLGPGEAKRSMVPPLHMRINRLVLDSLLDGLLTPVEDLVIP